MKKYMVVTVIDEKQGAAFFDDSSAARQYKMDAECGMGGFAQVYEWQDETEEECGAYVFLYD